MRERYLSPMNTKLTNKVLWPWSLTSTNIKQEVSNVVGGGRGLQAKGNYRGNNPTKAYNWLEHNETSEIRLNAIVAGE